MKQKIFFLLLFFTVIYNTSQSQVITFKAQKDYKPYGKFFIDSMQVNLPKFSNSLMEIRFWKVNYTNTRHQLFIFDLSKQKKWTLKAFSFCSWDWINFSNLNMTNILVSGAWDKRYDSLVEQDFLRMPTQASVERKWKSRNGIKTIIADGHSYVMELITKKGCRKYIYNNPEENLRYYDINNDELIRINFILKLLDEELHFSNQVSSKCE